AQPGGELVHLLARRQPPAQGQEAHLLVRGVLSQVADVVAAVDQDAVDAVDRTEAAASDDHTLESALVSHTPNPTPHPSQPTPPESEGCSVRFRKLPEG